MVMPVAQPRQGCGYAEPPEVHPRVRPVFEGVEAADSEPGRRGRGPPRGQGSGETGGGIGDWEFGIIFFETKGKTVI